MASPDWIGNALNQADICTVTVANTWATNDTATFTLGGKDLIVTIGTPFTTADVATLIARAWESATRINDALGSSNVGGQSIPEFAEILCTASGSVLTFTTRDSRFAGKPFQAYLTKSETTAGSGTLGSVTSVQAATGANHWDNADNWSGGSVPANDDTVVFRDSSVDVLHGLPSASKQVNVIIHNSYTGRIGLPKVNKDNSSKPYYEYRPRYVVLDDAGSGSSITHYIGMGPGNGPALVNINQTVLTTTFEVNSNRTQAVDGELFVNNLIAPAGGTLNVKKGTVYAGNQNASTAAWSAINISGREGDLAGIDVSVTENATASLTVKQTGGRLRLGQASWTSNGVTMIGGEITLTSPCPSLVWANGTVYDDGNGTIAAGTQNPRAVLDASRGAGTLTITNLTRHADTTIKDPNKRIVHTNPVVVSGARLSEVFRDTDYGYGRSYQIS